MTTIANTLYNCSPPLHYIIQCSGGIPCIMQCSGGLQLYSVFAILVMHQPYITFIFPMKTDMQNHQIQMTCMVSCRENLTLAGNFV